jgi:hypothetical protein
MLTSWWHAAAVLVLLCGLLPKLPGCPGLLLQVNAEALASSAELRDKWMKIQAETNQALKAIYDRWDIAHYPNFLRSVSMSHTGWEVLKLKMQEKLIAATSTAVIQTFVVSFMGSSVTAGHDSMFNQSFPVVTKALMEPAFRAAGIDLVTRNAAIGNNPCLPYDACVRTFAGPDADIVHWEQSYNCFGSDNEARVAFEQFIRQSLALPSHPVVIFTVSDTPNWEEKECTDEVRNKAIEISDEEKKLLELVESNPMEIATVLNNQPEWVGGHWSSMEDMFKAYKLAGLQLWNHGHYEKYKCHGPYVATWQCCSVSWHPSRLGHALRAAHHAYFWLLVYREAVKELLAGTDNIAALTAKIAKHTSAEKKHLPTAPLYPSRYSDSLQCYTSYEPRNDPSLHLNSIIIQPSAWKTDIMELLLDKLPEVIEKARGRGYLDYKYMVYGNKDSGPLNLKINAKSTGKGSMCGPPGVWGKLPDGFKQFWNISTDVYLTENVADTSAFQFDKNKAKKIRYTNDRPLDTQSICAHFEEEIPAGDHVLSVVPSTNIFVSVTYLIIP